MKVSARNAFKGKISRIVDGAVNAEVEVSLNGGDKIIAIVTEASVRSLALSVGKGVVAYVKAPWVMVLTGAPDMRFSARNQLNGTVAGVAKGGINSEVKIQLPGGSTIYSIVTNQAVQELGLKTGVPATALIKASHIILGVPV